MSPNMRGVTTGAKVAEFLSGNLPRRVAEPGWDHWFLSAYEIACEALVALGHAEPTEWGAVPLNEPRLPNRSPRWDDICMAVLGLAGQQRLISYRRHDGGMPTPRRGGFVIRRTGAPPPPPANIAASHGLGPAHAAAELLAVLECLGLVAAAAWTKAAETLFWRMQPAAWEMQIDSNPRFHKAVKRALHAMPGHIRDAITRLTLPIGVAEISLALQRWEAAQDELRNRFGAKARLGRKPDEAGIRRSLASQRCNELDWLFFRYWRLDDGWLPTEPAFQALEVFHDPLAESMRRAVIAAFAPNAKEFAL